MLKWCHLRKVKSDVQGLAALDLSISWTLPIPLIKKDSNGSNQREERSVERCVRPWRLLLGEAQIAVSKNRHGKRLC